MWARSRWVIIRESMPTMERTILTTFQAQFIDKGLDRYIHNYNKSTRTITFNNGSQILFMAENYDQDKELNRFKGLEINGGGADEVNELQEATFNKLIERAGSWTNAEEGCPIKLLFTCNPSIGWVKKRFYERYIAGTLPKDWCYIPAKITDNPYVDAKYLETLKNLPEEDYRIFVEGDWNAFQVNAPFLYAFVHEKHVNECAYNPNHEVYLSFDFNVDPITAVAFQHYNDKILAISEFRLENSDIYQLCERIKAAYPNALIRVTGDATGQNRSALTRGNLNYYTVIQEELGLSDLQMDVRTINPAVSDSRVLTNAILQNYHMEISPTGCPKLIEDCQYVEVDAKGDIIKDRSSEYKKADLLDCFRYYVYTYFHWFLDMRRE